MTVPNKTARIDSRVNRKRLQLRRLLKLGKNRLGLKIRRPSALGFGSPIRAPAQPIQNWDSAATAKPPRNRGDNAVFIATANFRPSTAAEDTKMETSDRDRRRGDDTRFNPRTSGLVLAFGPKTVDNRPSKTSISNP
jgi:hypothetical protein